MQPIRRHLVQPSIPRPLGRLTQLAWNLRWTWDTPTQALFQAIDPDRWEATGHNPILLLAETPQRRFDALAGDPAFRAVLDQVWAAFATACAPVATEEDRIAYFSAEFGLSETLPIYAGGLGVLAGDHLKAASDLGLPLVGVGLLYHDAAFHQHLDPTGWQTEVYTPIDPARLPLHRETPRVAVELPGRTVQARIWRVDVGRVPLYLLDPNVPENPAADRAHRLYQGGPVARLEQEILLGIGGLRALDALGCPPAVCHLNEGHAALLVVERIRRRMREQGLAFAAARDATAAGHVFTTHTPVPAGIDRFDPDLIGPYCDPMAADLGLTREQFLDLGREHLGDTAEPFCPAILALRCSASRNGVSQLHGQVSRRLFQGVWPAVPTDAVPIGAITNGIHPTTWTAGGIMEPLYDRFLGPAWRTRPADPTVWAGVATIPDGVLWAARNAARARLVAFLRPRLAAQLTRRGVPPTIGRATAQALADQALTIGFARRAATYKRGTLLFRQLERLTRLIGDPARPVQIVIAGKAHPDDAPAKELLRTIVTDTGRPELQHRVVFVEDYDLAIARQLIQGVDLWLTTPVRPHEASGTSGMKVVVNGGLNASILDGWWAEAYTAAVGWVIGEGTEDPDPERRDAADAEALYRVLEDEILPTFFLRDATGVPTAWVARMKASIQTLAPVFNTHRMVDEYAVRCYLPAARRARALATGAAAQALADWVSRIRAGWPDVRILAVQAPDPAAPLAGDTLPIAVDATLGGLRSTDVAVEVWHGPLDPVTGEISAPVRARLGAATALEGGRVRYQGAIRLTEHGPYGYAVCLLPNRVDQPEPAEVVPPIWAAAEAGSADPA